MPFKNLFEIDQLKTNFCTTVRWAANSDAVIVDVLCGW